MPLTVSFKETVMDRVRRDPEFAAALLRQGIDALLCEEFDVAKDLLRDYINATMGFDGLAREVRIPSKSLMRMLGQGGNPQASNLLAIIAALQRHAGIELHLAEIPLPKNPRSKKRKSSPAPRREGVRYPESSGAAYGALRETGKAFKRR
jgi:DNA-binding phage protein